MIRANQNITDEIPINKEQARTPRPGHHCSRKPALEDSGKIKKISDVPPRTYMRTVNAIIFIEIEIDSVAPGASGEID
jgi:hypothetical protein